ncbi:hypothetical protein KIPB_015223, partial [Kipferlia bialata]|eukprot:g15223.t1
MVALRLSDGMALLIALLFFPTIFNRRTEPTFVPLLQDYEYID